MTNTSLHFYNVIQLRNSKHYININTFNLSTREVCVIPILQTGTMRHRKMKCLVHGCTFSLTELEIDCRSSNF